MKRLLLIALISSLFFGCESVDPDRLVELKDVTFVMPETWEVFYQARNDAQIIIPGTEDMSHLTLTARELSGELDCEGYDNCFNLDLEDTTYGVYFTYGSVTPSDEDLETLVNSATLNKD